MNFEPHRQGMTVLPPDIDDATGEIIEGTSKVVDTRIANWEHDEIEDDSELINEAIQGDTDHPEHIDSESELAEISVEVNESTVAYDETMADTIASVDMGDSPADVTVQFLAHKVYAGELSPQDAFSEAINSGINPEYLAASYRKLKSYFE